MQNTGLTPNVHNIIIDFSEILIDSNNGFKKEKPEFRTKFDKRVSAIDPVNPVTHPEKLAGKQFYSGLKSKRPLSKC